MKLKKIKFISTSQINNLYYYNLLITKSTAWFFEGRENLQVNKWYDVEDGRFVRGKHDYFMLPENCVRMK
jgi:hypothetical protein